MNHDSEPRSIGGSDEQVTRIYQELRRVAARLMRQERAGHTLQPTALANEAYLRVFARERANVDSEPVRPIDHDQLLAAGVNAMRQILIDHHRRRHSAKRG
ncbi:MAG: ECF-type sigma factor, partial [Isosphaeraceae bacterium]